MNYGKSGIYSITSPSGKMYIGSSVNIKNRWKVHKRDLMKGTHHNKPLQSAYKKYGLHCLLFEIILICEAKSLLFFEQLAIDKYEPAYNTCRIAGSCLGVKATAETKLKMSNFRKNNPYIHAKTKAGYDESKRIWIEYSKSSIPTAGGSFGIGDVKEIFGGKNKSDKNPELQKIIKNRYSDVAYREKLSQARAEFIANGRIPKRLRNKIIVEENHKQDIRGELSEEQRATSG